MGIHPVGHSFESVVPGIDTELKSTADYTFAGRWKQDREALQKLRYLETAMELEAESNGKVQQESTRERSSSLT